MGVMPSSGWVFLGICFALVLYVIAGLGERTQPREGDGPTTLLADAIRAHRKLAEGMVHLGQRFLLVEQRLVASIPCLVVSAGIDDVAFRLSAQIGLRRGVGSPCCGA